MTYLSLFKNRVGDQGAVALFRALGDGEVLSNVDVLLLNSNRIGEEGMIALAAAASNGACRQHLTADQAVPLKQ